jgi:hypothetical protein
MQDAEFNHGKRHGKTPGRSGFLLADAFHFPLAAPLFMLYRVKLR